MFNDNFMTLDSCHSGYIAITAFVSCLHTVVFGGRHSTGTDINGLLSTRVFSMCLLCLAHLS